MKIAIGSNFRNSVGQLPRYVEQLRQLYAVCKQVGFDLVWIACEGDSTDSTRLKLVEYAQQLGVRQILVQRAHGGPVYGSTEAAERMKALSYVGNGVLENVEQDIDVLIYVESDLIWDPQTIFTLIAQLQPGYEVIAPLIFAGEHFYDVYLYRKNGSRFGPFAPYHSELHRTELTEVDSAGSCLVMMGYVARKCRMINDAALLGFCADVKANGFHIWVDPLLRIKHP